ncbi:MAG: hypothetical protein ABSH32_35395, partial [Bryobacteraceae bacterium]
MANGTVALAIYAAADGKKPFQEWVESLKDYEAQARVFVRLERVRLGNLGDCKPVGDGVSELRVKANTVHLTNIIMLSCFRGQRPPMEVSYERYRRGFDHTGDGCL